MRSSAVRSSALLLVMATVLALSSSSSAAEHGARSAAEHGSTKLQAAGPPGPVSVKPPAGPETASGGTGQPPANYPSPAPDKGKGKSGSVQPAVVNGQGDQLAVQTTLPSAATSYQGSYYLNCSGNGPVYGGELIGFCGFIQVYDSVSGYQTTTNNTQTDYIYDACGKQVGSGSSYGWHIVGTNYFQTSWTGSQLSTVPTSGVCWGQWSETYTFTQTFTDGQQLTDSLSDSFLAYAVNPAPPTAYGEGNGDASVHNPTCSGGDPVNCSSGNFSETFTDAAVPGRGPGLDLTRTYNSLSAATPGIFGYGWSSSYEAHLTVNGDGSVTVFEADGSQVTGVPAGGGAYTIPAWADSTLRQNGDATWTFVRRKATTYSFSASGQLTALTDRNGYSTQFAYNSAGQLATVTDAAGRTITVTFDANGFVSQIADPTGQVTSYGHDSAGNLTTVTDPLNRTRSFGYDAAHLLLTVSNPNHGVTTNVYDSSSRVTQQTDPAGLVTRFAYTGDNFSSAGGTTTITDPHANITVENYTSGVMLSITKGSGTAFSGTWSYGYDANTFGVTSVTDPNGHVSRSTYDSSGNLLTTTDALNRTTTYTYNAFNQPLTVTDPLGIVTTYTYDSNGNVLTKSVAGVGGSPTETTTYGYAVGHAGDVAEITDPAGHVTDYTYDAQGDVASTTTHPSSGVNDTTSYVYDQLGRKTCETSPVANAGGVQCPAAGLPRVPNTTTWTYDADGELTSETDPLGNSTSLSYDALGNRNEVTDPVGNVSKTTYDLDSRVSTVTAGYGTPVASTTSYGYDIAPGTGVCSTSVVAATYCASTSDPDGQTTVSYFDARDARIEQVQPSSGASISTYDAGGNLSTLTTNGGQANYGYDVANELTSITYSNPAPGFVAAANVTYGYDADGQRTSMTDGSGTSVSTYDSLERLASVTNGAGATVSYAYGLDNQVASITYPGRRQTVTRAYDGAGRESSVTDWLGHTTTFSYDANGNPTATAYPNSTTTASAYDAADNLLSTTDSLSSNPANPFASLAYAYNPDSQVQTETDTGTPSPTSQSYGYDQVNRLTSSATGSYGYNASGDPTQLPQGAQTFTPSHQVTGMASPISRVGTASAGDNGTGATLTLSLPAGVLADDQILLAVTLAGSQKIKSTPTGYTLVGSYSSGTAASNVKLTLYRRTAQTGDTGVTVTFSKTFAKAASLVAYRGVSPVTPIDVISSGTTLSGQSVVAPSLTTTKANDELVMAVGAESSSAGSWTAPSQMTTRVSQAGGPSIANALDDQELGAAGSTDSRTATFSVTGSLAGALVALQPAQSSYTYDSLGDRTSTTTPSGTSTLTYNQLGQMTAYGAKGYAYDGDGLRVSKKTGNKTESFVWGTSGSSGVPLLLVDGGTSYIYGPDGLPLEQLNGTTVLYYVQDQIGSTRVLTNSSGSVAATYTYSPYGSLAGSTGTATNPFGFAGSYTDSESGLLYLQHRYYDPATAQFVSVDPEVGATQSAYGYVGDNPLAAADPSGLLFGWVKSAATWVYDHSSTIATVSAVAAVVLAPVPVVGQVAEVVSIGAGALAGIHSLQDHQYLNAALDLTGAGLGGAALKYGLLAKSFPEFSLVGGSQGFVLRVDSAGAYLMQYLSLHFRDYRQLIAYYERLGLSYDAAAAAAAAASQALAGNNCP